MANSVCIIHYIHICVLCIYVYTYDIAVIASMAIIATIAMIAEFLDDQVQIHTISMMMLITSEHINNQE